MKSNKEFIFTLMLMIWAVTCFGFYPISQYYPNGMAYEIPVLFLMILSGYSKVEIGQHKIWFTLLGISLLGNYISSVYFSNVELLECIRTASFVHYFFVFFPLALINPEIKDIERVIVWLGRIALLVYYLQYYLFPEPIVQSLASGWRVAAGEFDMIRYNVTGELVMFLYLFYSVNNYFIHKKQYSIIPITLIIVMCILHGYRSWIFAMVVCLVIQYLLYIKFRFTLRAILFFLVGIIILYFVSDLPGIKDMFEKLNEKNDAQFSGNSSFLDIDRVLIFTYFFDRVMSFQEWFWGTGFFYGKVDDFISYNWVDLGFVGLTFTGGIFMTICWLRLLFLNMSSKIPKEYNYLAIFSLFVILGTLTLPLAFNDRAPAVQALALYFGYLLTRKCQIKKQIC